MLGLRSVRIALPAIAGMFPVLVTTILSAPSAWASSVDISRSIDVSRELFITDVGVVDDDRTQNGGAWSFGGLMTRLAGDINPEEFVAAWAEPAWPEPVECGGGAGHGPRRGEPAGAEGGGRTHAAAARLALGHLGLGDAVRGLALVGPGGQGPLTLS